MKRVALVMLSAALGMGLLSCAEMNLSSFGSFSSSSPSQGQGGEVYYMDAEKVWAVILRVMKAHAILYQVQRERKSMTTASLVPNRIRGWEGDLAGCDCEVTIDVGLKDMGPGNSAVTLKANFSGSKKDCPQTQESLERVFFAELDKGLMEAPIGQERKASEPAPEESPGMEPEQKTIVSNTANIRSQPAPKASIVTKLKRGENVEVLEKSGQWYRVELPDGRQGWVHESLVGPGEGKMEATGKAPVDSQPQRVEGKKAEPPLQEETPEKQMPPSPPPPVQKGAPPLEKTEEKQEAAVSKPAVISEPKVEVKSVGPVLCLWDRGPVDVYSRPNVFSPKAGTLPAGSRIKSFEKAGSFFRIEHEGLKGYVYQDFCKVMQ